METINIELTQIFVKVVQHGNFTRAAKALDITKSSVSKAISRLEKLTGTKLLLRTTRSQTLTEAGRSYFESCIAPIQALEEAQKMIYGMDAKIGGNIKITAPEDIGIKIISPIIGNLCQQHPDLSFNVLLTDRLIDLVKDGFDLAIRLGKLEDSQLKARYLGELNLILVASPEYLQKTGEIKKPEDLSNLRFLSINDFNFSKKISLQNHGETFQMTINPTIVSNQMSSLIEMTKTGAGILLVPSYLCTQEIESGTLIRVLPDWRHSDYPVSIVSPVSMLETARLRLVTDLLSEEIRKSLNN